MRHQLLCAIVVCGSAAPAFAGIAPAPLAAADKFARAETVVAGKVTAIEKETVRATALHAGAKEKVAYTVAVVKVDTALIGAANMTHLKVGFVPPDPNAPPVRGSGGAVRPRPAVPELKEGQTVLVYLSKHPTADFHVMTWQMLPSDLSSDAGKRDLDVAKRFAAALADPMKGLKSDKPAVRAETAAFLIVKHGAGTDFGKSELVAVDAAESALVLKGLASAPWTGDVPDQSLLAFRAFCQLGLTEKDGWKAPAGRPGESYITTTHNAFVEWLAGPGNDYRVKKLVPKK